MIPKILTTLATAALGAALFTATPGHGVPNEDACAARAGTAQACITDFQLPTR